MSQDWMIDVLEDLRNFAANNQLPKLTEQLDDTIHIAVAELTGHVAKSTSVGHDASSDGSVPRTRGAV